MQKTGEWIENSFEDFIDGSFGNAGQNIYVSKRGRLQRIFRYDFNKDGYADIAFANSQDMGERPDASVINSPLQEREIVELPTQGAYGGLCTDLNGDGNDDLVLAHQNNGVHNDVPAYVYYGSDDGITGKYRIELSAPNAFDVAAGDFSGSGKKDLAFATNGIIRLFTHMEQGYYEHEFTDIDVDSPVIFLEAGDLNGDGYDDLCIRTADGKVMVLWGSERGLEKSERTILDTAAEKIIASVGTTAGRSPWNSTWRPCIVQLGGETLLYTVEDNKALFYRAAGRELRQSLELSLPGSVYALSADCTGSGYNDLILCICTDIEHTEKSYIFSGDADGIDENRFITFEAKSLRSAAVDDLDNDGINELILCQGQDGIRFSLQTPLYKIYPDWSLKKTAEYPVHDAMDVYAAHSRNNKQLIFINHESGRVRGDVDLNVYYNSADGFDAERKDVLSTWAGTDTICCDFNDNGYHDLLVCNCAENSVGQEIDPGSFLYRGGVDGFADDDKEIFPTLRAHGCAVGDFRRSGYLDIVFAGFYNASLLIFKGGENGYDMQHPQKIVLDPGLDDSYEPVPPSADIFSEKKVGKTDPNFSEPRFILAADLDNNGYLDLCVSQIAGDKFMILHGGPDGFSRENVTYLPVVDSVCSQAADLNNNGWLDLIVGGYSDSSKNWVHDSNLTIFWGSADGFSKNRSTQLPGHSCNSITVADFNGNGILDIFVTSYNGGRDRDLDAYLYWGRPDGIYSEKHRKRFFTHSSCGSIALDFNNNGYKDIAVSNHKTYGDHKGYSQIWHNSKSGFSEEHITWLPTNGPHGLMTVDAGNIMDRGEEEFYISSVNQLDSVYTLYELLWEAEIWPLTWVKCQLRCADSEEAIESAVWQGPEGEGSWFETPGRIENESLRGRFVQYKLALGAKNGGNSPVVTSVTVRYGT